jgi:DNA-binding winged helix-turn-helix (wHTH) protein/TolB-like protein/tetratricopeptide (TPR) repeat protein
MTTEFTKVYEFGPFRLDPRERLLLRDGSPIPVTAKAFDVLLILVQRNGHLVEKADLIKSIWPDSFVEDGNLNVAICALRKALDDERGQPSYIQTVPKRGYRFIREVHSVVTSDPEDVETVPSLPVLETRRKPLPLILQGAFLVLTVLGSIAIIPRLTRPNSTQNGVGDIRSLAVLPMRPLNIGSDVKYLSLGISDEVITRLAATGQIIVRPTSSVVRYMGSSIDPLAIGREQKVDAVLEGTIEVLSDRVRVAVQLVRVRDGFLLWADSFTESPQQVSALEGEVAERVVQAVPLSLSGQVKKRFDRPGTQSSKAHTLYLYGRYYSSKRTPDALHQSIDYFRQSIAEDPNYALAYAGLADSYIALGSYGEEPNQSYPNARNAARSAIALDDSIASAHASLAMVSFQYGWNWLDAEKEFRRAIALNPNDAVTRVWYGHYLVAMGHNKEAVDQAERAEELDPVSPIVNTAVDRIFFWNREYDQAIEGYGTILKLEPSFASAHTRLGLGMTYLAKGDVTDAIREFEECQQLSGPDPYVTGLLGYAQALSGNSDAAHKLLDELTLHSRSQYVPPFSFALIYIGLGQNDRAFEWLEKSYQDRSIHMLYSKNNPLLDPLRSNPRFDSLIQRMGI